ncbi:MAG: hypothetical protein ACLFOY_01490 [Desulfatibacillaceae bacterium]
MIDIIRLDNGLELTLLDKSFIITSDRWNVVLLVRVPVPAHRVLDGTDAAGPTPGDIAEAMGDPVVFEKKLERIFIDEGEKQEVLDEMVDSFLETTRVYLSNPGFAKRFLLRRYAEEGKRRQLEQMRRRHFRAES